MMKVHLSVQINIFHNLSNSGDKIHSDVSTLKYFGQLLSERNVKMSKIRSFTFPLKKLNLYPPVHAIMK